MFSTDLIEKCGRQILATKLHEESDNDTNYFTDADLAILGNEDAIYKKYTTDIRKEYSIYPDILYKPERKKVLQHFLKMNRIFKTDWFFNKYEEQARINIEDEYSLL